MTAAGERRGTGGPTTPAWPELSYAASRETMATLHLWSQIVGKVRLAQTPWLNHSWQVALYLSARGLTTGPIEHGVRLFEIEFDFVAGQLIVRTDGPGATLPLEPGAVATFHRRLLDTLDRLGLKVAIHGAPNELPDAVPFRMDTAPRAYDPAAAHAFWRALVQADRVFRRFRTGFLGKASPVHFFWGSFDLAVTRFSGRPAPRHRGGTPNLPDAVIREAYSHEVSSAGFWPGGQGVDEAHFYSYAYPEPDGFAVAAVPGAARYDAAMGMFLLPYEAVRTAPDPDGALLDFLQATYAAAADAGGWDRAALDCAIGQAGVPRSV